MILMNNFRAEPDEMRSAELASVERVLRSGWYILGKEVEAFEAAWASVCDVPYAVGVANGMDAIEIGLRALGIGGGDEVITTPMTAFATVLAILGAGAVPVLADVDPRTGLLDVQSVRRCITSRTKAVLLVHLYGQVRDLDIWRSFCADHGIALIEDCAQAHLARWQGKCAGSFGVFGAYSFYPTKNLGALGDAGAIVSMNPDLCSQSKVIRNYGQSVRYQHPVLGLNSRLDELQAAILTTRMKWLDGFTERRRAIARKYFDGIVNESVTLLSNPVESENHVYHLFVLLSGDRDALADHLQLRGVQTLAHYPVPVHHQPPCVNAQRDPQGLPHSERHALRCLSIPCHPQLSDEDVDMVIAAVNDFR